MKIASQKPTENLDTEIQSNPTKKMRNNFLKKFKEEVKRQIFCQVCKSLSEYAGKSMSDEKKFETIVLGVKQACYQENSKLYCDGFISLEGPFVKENIEFFLKNEPGKVCQMTQIQCKNNFDQKLEDFDNWKAEMLKSAPNEFSYEIKTPTEKNGSYSILQFNDIHLDYGYLEGQSIQCPLQYGCCSKVGGPAADKSDTSGYWASVTGYCDIPLRFFDKTIEFIKNNLLVNGKVDMVIWLGDDSDHSGYLSDYERNFSYSKYISKALKENFHTKGVPVIPVLGNHELFPVDIYNFVDGQTNPNILKRSTEYFKDFQDQDELDQFTKTGYYTKLLNPENSRYQFVNKPLRLIAIFVGAVDGNNTFMWQQKFDPMDQMSWLNDVLKSAEIKNEDVFILKHIPLGIQQNEAASKHMNVILTRYGNNIKGVFAGHTHKDEMGFLFSVEDKEKPKEHNIVDELEPLLYVEAGGVLERGSVLGDIADIVIDKKPKKEKPLKKRKRQYFAQEFVGTSLTTSSRNQPSFRVYHVDKDTNMVSDYDQYRVKDLDKANRLGPEGDIEFEIAYSFKEYWGMDKMSPENMISLYDKLKGNGEDTKEAIEKYWDVYLSGNQHMNDYKMTKADFDFVQCSIETDEQVFKKCMSEPGREQQQGPSGSALAAYDFLSATLFDSWVKPTNQEYGKWGFEKSFND